MFETTKHNLSGGEVTIDWDALRNTSLIAIGKIRDEMNRHMHNLYKFNPREISSSEMAHSADELKRLAVQLAIACETFHALDEGSLKERPELKVVNR